MSSGMRDFFHPPPLTGIQKVLEEHRMTGTSADGITGICACGAGVDWDTEHWAEVLTREGFGDLKPARELVVAWHMRSREILDKARYMESVGASLLGTQYRLLRSQAYKFMANRLDRVVNEKPEGK